MFSQFQKGNKTVFNLCFNQQVASIGLINSQLPPIAHSKLVVVSFHLCVAPNERLSFTATSVWGGFEEYSRSIHTYVCKCPNHLNRCSRTLLTRPMSLYSSYIQMGSKIIRNIFQNNQGHPYLHLISCLFAIGLYCDD